MREAGDKLRQLGVKVTEIDFSNRSHPDRDFERAWQRDGIWQFGYAGHGNAGLAVPGLNGIGVDADTVNPPYRLAAVIMYACRSAEGCQVGINADGSLIHAYFRDHVAPGGIFLGFEGLVITGIQERVVAKTVPE